MWATEVPEIVQLAFTMELLAIYNMSEARSEHKVCFWASWAAKKSPKESDLRPPPQAKRVFWIESGKGRSNFPGITGCQAHTHQQHCSERGAVSRKKYYFRVLWRSIIRHTGVATLTLDWNPRWFPHLLLYLLLRNLIAPTTMLFSCYLST